MARNEEKNLARLNRLLLQNKKDEDLKKNPPRPRLDTLHTVEDIKQWLPSIKRDIDFNLKQSQVPCYPERKIQEFRSNIDHLQGLYKAFIRKLKGLDPQLTSIPWNDRVYQSRKRHCNEEASQSDDIIHQDSSEVESKKGKLFLNGEELDENDESSTEKIQISESVKHSKTKSAKCQEDKETSNEAITNSVIMVTAAFIPIHTPILDTENKRKNVSKDSSDKPNTNVNQELQDQPLTFKGLQDQPLTFKGLQDQPLTFKGLQDQPLNFRTSTESMKGVNTTISDNSTYRQTLTLGLPYSDSDSDTSDNG